MLAVPLTLLARALLIETNPRLGWALPLIAGKAEPTEQRKPRLLRSRSNERKNMSELTSEAPVLDLLKSMTADSIAASSLDVQTLALVRIAALVAVDAPPVSYLLNLEAATEVGIDPEEVRGVLAAIAPIVGTARVASATGNIVEALDIALEVAEFAAESEE
jgi:4-carboxymuconolactone decarboxylase